MRKPASLMAPWKSNRRAIQKNNDFNRLPMTIKREGVGSDARVEYFLL